MCVCVIKNTPTNLTTCALLFVDTFQCVSTESFTIKDLLCKTPWRHIEIQLTQKQTHAQARKQHTVGRYKGSGAVQGDAYGTVWWPSQRVCVIVLVGGLCVIVPGSGNQHLAHSCCVVLVPELFPGTHGELQEIGAQCPFIATRKANHTKCQHCETWEWKVSRSQFGVLVQKPRPATPR